mgnify:CR=1 FL=1
METNSMRISSQSIRYAKVQNLMHNVNEQNLMAQHRHQKLRKALGIDKVDKQKYETHANENIGKLVQKNEEVTIQTITGMQSLYRQRQWKNETFGNTSL